MIKEQKIHEELTFSPEDITDIQIEEGKDGKPSIKRATITVIKPGMSKNKNYYSPAVLEKLPPHIKVKPKMCMDHDVWASMFGLGRSLKEWAATVDEPWYDQKTESVKAKIRMTPNPSTAWLHEAMKDNPSDVGVSIDAMVKAKEEERDGPNGTKEKVKIIEDWIGLNSIDFVTYAAAGGGIDRVAASTDPQGLLELLVKTALLSQAEKYNKQNNLEEYSMTLELLKKENPEIVAAIIQENLKTLTDSNILLENEVKVLKAEKEKLGAKEIDISSKLTESEKTVLELKKKLDEKEVKEKEALWLATVNQKISESLKKEKPILQERHITEPFKNLLIGCIDKPEMVDVYIKEREDLISTVTPAITGQGLRAKGAEGTTPVKLTDDELVSGIKALRN